MVTINSVKAPSNSYDKRRILLPNCLPGGLSYFNLVAGDYEVWLIGAGGYFSVSNTSASGAGGCAIKRFKNTSTYSISFSASGNAYLTAGSSGSGSTLAYAEVGSPDGTGTATGDEIFISSPYNYHSYGGGGVGATYDAQGFRGGAGFLSDVRVSSADTYNGYSAMCSDSIENLSLFESKNQNFWWTPFDFCSKAGRRVQYNQNNTRPYVYMGNAFGDGGLGAGGATGEGSRGGNGGLMAGGGSGPSGYPGGSGGPGGGKGAGATSGNYGGSAFAIVYWR